jgi:glutamate--cysteine ligase catalytic subunit
MRLRRDLISAAIDSRDRVVTLTNYPLMGVGDFTEPSTKPGGDVANSLFTSDDLIHPHHRFATLTRNIRLRKGSHVAISACGRGATPFFVRF